MWLFRFRNYVRFERGLYLRCRQPLYRYAPYAGLDVVPVAVPIARPCAVGDVPDSSRHAPLRDDSHDSRLHGSVSRRRMSDWSRCQWNLPDGYPAYAGYPRRRTEIRMFGRTMDPVFAGCGQRLGWVWACNHREPPRAFGDRRAADREGSGDRGRPPSETIVGVASAGHADGSRFPAKGRPALSSLKFDGSWSRREGWTGNRVMPNVPTGRRPCHQSDRTNSPPGSGRR